MGVLPPDLRNPSLVPGRFLLRRCPKSGKEWAKERRVLFGDVIAHERPQTPLRREGLGTRLAKPRFRPDS